MFSVSLPYFSLESTETMNRAKCISTSFVSMMEVHG